MVKSAGVLAAFVLVLLSVRPAQAYPWMIRHEYTACAQCHADPSGAGLVTLYGRAQGEILLRTHYTRKADEDPGRAATFLWGAVPLPDEVLVEAVSRSAELQTRVALPGPGPAPAPANQFIQMQAELRAQITEGKFRANASLGFAQIGDTLAEITDRPTNNLISREHWLGYDATDNLLIRAGRMEVPFGIRDNTHNMYIHVETRDDIDQDQEYGVSAAYSGSKIRGELMAVAGNLLVRDPNEREQGYYGYAETVVYPKTAVGVSSLLTHTQDDIGAAAPGSIALHIPLTRNAEGVFLRASPIEQVVILAEDDMLLYVFQTTTTSTTGPGTSSTTTGNTQHIGSTGMVQADIEPIQGLHLIGATGWFQDPIPGQEGRSLEYWEGVEWFFASHADVRLDAVQNDIPVGPGQRAHSTTLIGQFHFYL